MKEKDIFKRTRKNIIFISISIVMMTLLIFAIITEGLYQAKVFNNVDQQLQTQRNMVICDKSIIKGEEVIMPAPLATNLISFVWKEGVLVDRSPHEYYGENMYPNMGELPFDEIVTLKDGAYTYRAVQFKKQGLIIQLLMNVDLEVTSVVNLGKILALSFIILIGITLALASYLAILVLKPLKMVYSKQIAFIQDASHEMRTPLAIIKGRLELLVKYRKDMLEEHLEEISSIMKEIHGLEKLNNDLLLMSKEDMGLKAELSKFEVNQFIREIGEFYEDFAAIQDKELVINLFQEECIVNWDRGKVKRCIVILIENALKYTEVGDRIFFSIEKNDKFIEIEVKDTGIGIKQEDQKRIFDRFFRSSEVRASDIEGSGIGLSLLKSIAVGLGIKVSVSSIYGLETSFKLRIPINLET